MSLGLLGRAGFLAVALSAATSAAAADDTQLWTSASAIAKLSDRWRLSEDVTARFSDSRNGLYEIEANSLLGYRINRTVILWAGYTYNPTYSGGHRTDTEHRAREQITFGNFTALGKRGFVGRLRFEQRWRDRVDGTGWRVRPFVRYMLPVRKRGRTSLVFSVEPFFNLNTTAFQRTSGLDRTRTFVGISTPVTKHLAAEIGYLNQHVFVRHGPDRDDHVAAISINLLL